MTEIMIESQLASLAPLVRDYTPANNVLEHLGSVDIVTLSGTAGAGKDTLRNLMPYPKVVSLTSRDKRENETEGQDYNFYNTSQKMDELGEALANNELVQVKLGPTGHLYGSMANAYPSRGIALMDCVASQAQEFRDLGFKSCKNIYITPVSFSELLARLTKRNSETPGSLIKRFIEGVSSLETGLSDPEFMFVLNDNLGVAIDHTMDIVQDMDVPSSRQRIARNAGAAVLGDMLEYIDL